MLDIKLIRENPELVKENIKKKFQDSKLPLVDEVIEIDKTIRNYKQEVEQLRKQRNDLSKQIGLFMRDKKLAEAEEANAVVARGNKII